MDSTVALAQRLPAAVRFVQGPRRSEKGGSVRFVPYEDGRNGTPLALAPRRSDAAFTSPTHHVTPRQKRSERNATRHAAPRRLRR